MEFVFLTCKSAMKYLLKSVEKVALVINGLKGQYNKFQPGSSFSSLESVWETDQYVKVIMILV